MPFFAHLVTVARFTFSSLAISEAFKYAFIYTRIDEEKDAVKWYFVASVASYFGNRVVAKKFQNGLMLPNLFFNGSLNGVVWQLTVNQVLI